MKTVIFLLILVSSSLYAINPVSPVKIKSPNGIIELSIYLKDGNPYYTLHREGVDVVRESRLGLILKEGTFAEGGFVIADIKESAVDENWEPVLGEYKTIRNNYKGLQVSLREAEGAKRTMILHFRVFNDGIGFRYEFPVQQNLRYFVVKEELTEFNMNGDHKAFWIPGDYDSNEYPYTTSKLSEVDAWKLPLISNGSRAENTPDQYAVQTPLMLKAADGLYINIHEAALVNYPAMQLHVDRTTHGLSAVLVPDAVGNKGYLRTQATTPWRTIIVSDKASDILASTLILNLNEPSQLNDESWIKPMKYLGVWWEMQTGHSKWNYSDNLDLLSPEGKPFPNGNHGANTANVKRYIDFASRHGIEGVLVEGWNRGWEEWTGDWKEDNFDYVSPYPDFNVEELSRYAKMKGVKMIMHNETGGSATNYERRMDSAFRFMNNYGYPAVKTGYVGRIIPRGEHHDGQWMVNHYVRAAQKAAEHKVMINMHESVRPTGLNRTYPNWVANEASRGNEWNAFSDGSAPDHETILPFTRMVGGPMDYTPGIFKMSAYAKDAPLRRMHSTLAKQLALYVTIYSPLQMAADLPENYEAHLDAFQFIKDVACDWDDTWIVEAEPGDYLTIARKAKRTDDWFVGAITDENRRTAVIPLQFLDKSVRYLATIYKDDKTAHWQDNPEAYLIEKFIVDNKSVLKIDLAQGGGAAISIVPAGKSDIKHFRAYK